MLRRKTSSFYSPSNCCSSTTLKNYLTLFFALLLMSSLLVSSALAENWKGQNLDKDGTLHVMNPAEPMEPPKTIELKELWRLGGDTDDEDEFFGVISRILTDKDGNVYLLDTQLSEVKIFSPDGEFIRTIGREGEGPGEFRIPTGMFFTQSGNLGVLQVAPGKIVLLSPEGDPAGEHPLPPTEDGGFLILRNGQFRNNNLVLMVSKNLFSEGKFEQVQYLCSIDPDGKETAHYYEAIAGIDFANPVLDEVQWNNFANRWDIGPDGRVFSAPDFLAYQIYVWKPDGSVDRIIEREYPHRKRTPEELDLVDQIMGVFLRQIPNGKLKTSEFSSDIELMFTRDDGSLWVGAGTGTNDNPEGSLGIFDVFDEQGRFIRQVTLMGEGEAGVDGYYFVKNRLYVVTDLLQASMTMQAGGQSFQLGDEEPEPMEVICYELEENLHKSK